MTIQEHNQLNAQRMRALLRGNEIRTKRAQDKARVAHGQLSAAEILRHLPQHWKSAKLVDLLLLVPKVGQVKARRMAEAQGVTLRHHLDQITLAQRRRIAEELEAKGWTPDVQ